MKHRFTDEISVSVELRRYLDEAGRVAIWPSKSRPRQSLFAELAALAENLTNPGPFLTFVQSDLTPGLVL